MNEERTLKKKLEALDLFIDHMVDRYDKLYAINFLLHTCNFTQKEVKELGFDMCDIKLVYHNPDLDY